MAPAARGFAGLESLIPKIEVKPLPAAPAPVPSPAPARSTTSRVAPVPEKVDRDTGPLSVKIIGGLIVMGIIWALIENNSERPELAGTDTPATPSSPTQSAPTVEAPVPAPAVPADTPVFEMRPDTPYKPILDANELAFCLAEDLRMNTVKPLVNQYSHAEIAGFNAHVEAYNSRCGRYEYHQSDMTAAQAYLDGHRLEIMNQARTWPARWRRGRDTS